MKDRYDMRAELRGDAVPLALIAAMAGTGVVALPHLPALVPLHWNAAGQVNGWGPAWLAALLLPALALAVWLLMLALPTIDPRRRAYARFAVTYRIMRVLAVAAIAAADAAVLASGLGARFSAPVIRVLSVSVLLLVLGNLLPRVQPTWFTGIRTPWTLSSDEVWRRTHRFGGRLFMLAGVAQLAALLVASRTRMVVTLAAVILPAVAATAYSYWLYRRLCPDAPLQRR